MAKKVLLFFPSYRSIEAAPPLALLALAPIAEQRGLEVDVVDSTIQPDYRERIVTQLDGALCVGISIVTGPMIVEAIEVAKAIKAARPDVPVILDRLLHNEILAGIEGCSYRDSEGRIIHNPSRRTVNISELPSKAYHLVD